MNQSSDTLDIKPVNPHAHVAPPELVLPDQNILVDNDPSAADEARAQIESLHNSTASLPTAEVDHTDISPEQPPVSPAHQQLKSEPKQQLADMTGKLKHLAHSIPHSKGRSIDPAPIEEANEKHDSKLSAKLPSRAKPIISAIASFALILAVLKSPVLFTQISYLFGDKPSVNEQIGEVLPAAGGTPVSATPLLTIPKINVKAPVVFEPSLQEAQIQHALEGGVVHYGNTALPGQAGNSVIFGHSSNDWWEPGNYKFVFVLLDKLVAGDTYSIDYNGTKYIYEVTGTKIVRPNDLSVLAQTADPTSTLITCSPPGWSTNRLIISAKQTSPQPGQTAPTTKPSPRLNSNNVLPGSAPSFTDQIGQAWKGFTEAIFGKADQASDQNSQPQTLPSK